MKKIERIPKVMISLLLVIALALTASAQVVGAADGGKRYVSEVKLGYGETAAEAAEPLLSEGYTIVTCDTWNIDVGEKYKKFADLNQGGSSNNALMRKGKAIVYLGYKTTDNPDEAITDLATMNMKGGYSFADYQKLLEEHKEQVIKPFVSKFMGTIKEYRANYLGDNADNKAKAEYIHDVLNKITDDDTGMGMGDLFLAETKDELGDAYDKLSDAEKKQHGDLVTVLAQGSGAIVALMEQLLTISADTADDTWLDRFLALDTDGLIKQFTDGGMTPSDAQKEMAAQYGDDAKAIAEKWEYLRSELIDYRDSEAGQELAASVEEDAGDTGEAVGDTAPSDEEIRESYDEPLEGEIDEETEQKLDELEDVTDAKSAFKAASVLSEAAEDAIQETKESTLEMLYLYLYSTPYGEGTLLDFFLQPASEVSGENISRLYPIAASLSDGQRAGLDFLSLEQLMKIGVTDNAVYTYAAQNLDEIMADAATVSVYYGVNRELFSDGVALTSEALRKNPSNASIFNEDTLGVSVVYNGLFALAGIAGAIGFVKTVKSIMSYQVSFTSTQHYMVPKAIESYQNFAKQARMIKSCCEKSGTKFDVVFKYKYYDDDVLDIIVKNPGGEDLTLQVSKEFADIGDLDSFDTAMNKLSDAKMEVQEAVTETQYFGRPWGRYILAGAFFVVMAAASAYSIYCTYQEMSAYYNQEMTKIPKYIVDEVDITTVDENGNKTFVRNDTAYYEVVRCNRTAASADYPAMRDYGDLNGDVAKQWLALYVRRDGSAPILASSFAVVKGKTDLPEGYEKGVHMIGEKSAVNMTDSKYTYNDEMNGIYVYYRTDAFAAKAETASVFGTGFAVAIGAGALVLGLIIGAVIAGTIKKKKETAA